MKNNAEPFIAALRGNSRYTRLVQTKPDELASATNPVLPAKDVFMIFNRVMNNQVKAVNPPSVGECTSDRDPHESTERMPWDSLSPQDRSRMMAQKNNNRFYKVLKAKS